MSVEEPTYCLTPVDSQEDLLAQLSTPEPSMHTAWQFGNTLFTYTPGNSEGDLVLNVIRDGQLIASLQMTSISSVALETTIDWLLRGGDTLLGYADFRLLDLSTETPTAPRTPPDSQSDREKPPVMEPEASEAAALGSAVCTWPHDMLHIWEARSPHLSGHEVGLHPLSRQTVQSS